MPHVVGLFDTRAEAQAAIERLRQGGVGVDSISVAMKEPGEADALAETTGTEHLTEEGSAVGAVSGAAVGTLVGLLVAGTPLLLPGIGMFLVAGPLAAALAGAGVGAASGGILGALVGSGIPEHEAADYAEGLEGDRVVVSAHVEDGMAAEARRILDEEGSRRTRSV